MQALTGIIYYFIPGNLMIPVKAKSQFSRLKEAFYLRKCELKGNIMKKSSNYLIIIYF